MLKSKECVEKSNDTRQVQEDNAHPGEEDDGLQVVGEPRAAMNDVLCHQQNDEKRGPSLDEH